MMTATLLMRSEFKYDASNGSQLPAAPLFRDNFRKIERWLGLDIGRLGGIEPGKPEEAMHMELGTLPVSHYAL